MLKWLTTILMLPLWSASTFSAPTMGQHYPLDSAQSMITIIIDDLGINRAMSQRALSLSGDLTYAILPHSPHGRELAQLAHEQNKEVILHLPMEPIDQRPVDKGALTAQQTQQEFLHTLRDDLQRIPHIQGVNNHMGSLLTQNPKKMQWLMQELAQHQQLYFIDSRTTPKSVGYRQAMKQGLPSLRRNIFLDNDNDIAAINRQFIKLLNIARRYGSAVAIGHPYPETLTYLENMLPALPLLGIKLLPASQLIEHKTRMAHAQPASPLQTAELLDNVEPEDSSLPTPNLVP